MKNLYLISLAVAAAVCLPQCAAWAQHGHGYDNGCEPHCERAQDHGKNGNRGYKGGFANGHDNRPDRGQQEGERGAGPSRDFYRGERLPSYYRAPRFVVDDWRAHGLRTPPRGYHWVQTGGDYVLVAIATGIILELLLNQ